MKFLGVDIGTGGSRAVAIDEAGAIVAQATVDHAPFASPHTGWSEQSPDDWWRAASEAIANVMQTVSADEIGGVSFSGQMHGSVFLDESDTVIRPALLWNDQRTAPQVAQLRNTIGNPGIIEMVANPAVTGIALPKLFAGGPKWPKRAIQFIGHDGAEKGLWGRDYFTENPTVPITSIVTQLNVDMIGRYQNPGDENHPQNKELPKQDEIYLIGSRMMSTELGDLSDSVNKSFLNLKFNFRYDDPNDPEQFFYRSDHFNYARRGVPIIFYMDGSHADYHRVTDTVDKINFNSMEKVAKTIYATGWELSNRAVRPKVDKPLPQSVIGSN